MLNKPFVITIILMLIAVINTNAQKTKKQWYEGTEMKPITYPCAIDKSEQPALFFNASIGKPAPLLVALHSWSNDYRQNTGCFNFCKKNNWHLIQPNFRGRNNRPEAMGSDMVVQDILDAVKFVQKTANVDPERIYLSGYSGGGMAALLMAGCHPEIWAGVTAWCPVTDLLSWHKHDFEPHHKCYAKEIERAVGGIPGKDKKATEECLKRSPLTYLKNAKNISIDINAGIHDGHPKTGTVPVSHSFKAFNEIVPENERISDADIAVFVKEKRAPESLESDYKDRDFGKRKIYFRKICGNARITIFDGGHQAITHAGLHFLGKQRKGKKANWNYHSKKQIVPEKIDTIGD